MCASGIILRLRQINTEMIKYSGVKCVRSAAGSAKVRATIGLS